MQKGLYKSIIEGWWTLGQEYCLINDTLCVKSCCEWFKKTVYKIVNYTQYILHFSLDKFRTS